VVKKENRLRGSLIASFTGSILENSIDCNLSKIDTDQEVSYAT